MTDGLDNTAASPVAWQGVSMVNVALGKVVMQGVLA